MAIISILFLSIPVSLKTVLVVFIIVMAVIAINRYALLKTDSSIHKISFSSNRKCKIELLNGKEYEVKLTASDWFFNYFAVLIMQSKTNKFKVTIAKDTMSQEQFYVLRLYLRSLNK